MPTANMLLIKNAIILAPGSAFHQKKRDILIRKGRIELIRAKIEEEPKVKTLDVKGAFVSPGWVDVGVQVGDPGLEHREDLDSVLAAAASGGYTAILSQPNTKPAIHTKSEVAYLLNRSNTNLVDLYPIAALSEACGGKDLTEMYDMHHSGAVAFSDGKYPVQDSGLLKRALQYVLAFDGLIINPVQDAGIAGSGQVHEGMVSTSLGMKGIPALAEEVMLQRDISLLKYTASRLHVANISTGAAVQMIRAAKAEGLRISASVPAMNLAITEEALLDFNTYYKVLPPLRGKSDAKALIRGLKSGTIDLISSNHMPYEGESKDLEFPYAKFGAIGLETTFAMLNTFLEGQLSPEELVQILAINPRKLFALPPVDISEEAEANLTIFNTTEEWTYEAAAIRSKSRNSPFIGTTFKGKVIGVVNKGQVFLNQ